MPAPHAGPAWNLARGDLRVSENRRFLVHRDGTPFLWIGDTAWELVHRGTREEIERYLEKRRAQGFTVVKTVLLAEFGGVETPNAYGHLPLAGGDPARPDVRPGPANDYWDHVDFAVDAAAKKGLTMGLLPTWGDKVWPAGAGTPSPAFNPSNARAYGRFLGRRYRDRPNLIWILGGDRAVAGPGVDTAPVWRAMSAGLAEGDGGRHLQSFHPWRPDSSSRWFHGDKWLAFNMLQSGHGARDFPNWARIAGDFALWPPKPCLDGEPRYEDHPVNHRAELGYFDDYDVRQAAYWAVFAGALGHTYGNHNVWQMYVPGRALSRTQPRTPWPEALDQRGAWSMLPLRRLLLSRPFLTRVPDPSVVVSGHGEGADHVEAARDQNGTYAFVYLPTGKPVRVDLRKIGGARVRAWWFDPRTGKATDAGTLEAPDRSRFHHAFTPPVDYVGRGQDWVLVLDDAARAYGPPGEPPGG